MSCFGNTHFVIQSRESFRAFKKSLKLWATGILFSRWKTLVRASVVVFVFLQLWKILGKPCMQNFFLAGAELTVAGISWASIHHILHLTLSNNARQCLYSKDQENGFDVSDGLDLGFMRIDFSFCFLSTDGYSRS